MFKNRNNFMDSLMLEYYNYRQSYLERQMKQSSETPLNNKIHFSKGKKSNTQPDKVTKEPQPRRSCRRPLGTIKLWNEMENQKIKKSNQTRVNTTEAIKFEKEFNHDDNNQNSRPKLHMLKLMAASAEPLPLTDWYNSFPYSSWRVPRPNTTELITSSKHYRAKFQYISNSINELFKNKQTLKTYPVQKKVNAGTMTSNSTMGILEIRGTRYKNQNKLVQTEMEQKKIILSEEDDVVESNASVRFVMTSLATQTDFAMEKTAEEKHHSNNIKEAVNCAISYSSKTTQANGVGESNFDKASDEISEINHNQSMKPDKKIDTDDNCKNLESVNQPGSVLVKSPNISQYIDDCILELESTTKLHENTLSKESSINAAVKEQIVKEISNPQCKMKESLVEMPISSNMSNSSNDVQRNEGEHNSNLSTPNSNEQADEYDHHNLPDFFTRIGLQSPAPPLENQQKILSSDKKEDLGLNRTRPKTSMPRKPVAQVRLVSREPSIADSIELESIVAQLRAKTAPAVERPLKSILKTRKSIIRIDSTENMDNSINNYKTGYAESYKKSLNLHLDPKVFQDFESKKVCNHSSRKDLFQERQI
jgi:hypothetical protein